MNTYLAIDHNDDIILSVIAENEVEAKEKVEFQLNRPGRIDLKAFWMRGGCKIQKQVEKER